MLSLNIVKTEAMRPAIADRISDPKMNHATMADHAAGRNRSEQPPEHAAKHATEHEHDDDGERIKRIGELEKVGVIAVLLWPWQARQRLAVDHPDDPVDTGGNSTGKIPVLEFRRDDLVDDALGGDVVERAFEPVADLDAELAVILGDNEKRAVIDLLAPDLPGLRDPDRILLDGFGCVVGTISTAIWLPFLSSKSLRVCVSEAISPLRASRSGRSPAPTRAAPRHRPRPRKPSTAAAPEGKLLQRSSRWSRSGCRDYHLRGAARRGLKSTFGAVEISFSLSTVKFGLSL